jgi:hypothetical protein
LEWRFLPAVDENWPLFACDCRIEGLSLPGFFEPVHLCKAIHLNVQERPPIEVRLKDVVLVPFDVAKFPRIGLALITDGGIGHGLWTQLDANLVADASFTAVSATRPHHLAEKKKFRGGSTPSNSTIVQSRVDQNMLLLPATFDHLGSVGPLTHRFLYVSQPDNPAPPLDTYSHCHLSSNTET